MPSETSTSGPSVNSANTAYHRCVILLVIVTIAFLSLSMLRPFHTYRYWISPEFVHPEIVNRHAEIPPSDAEEQLHSHSRGVDSQTGRQTMHAVLQKDALEVVSTARHTENEYLNFSFTVTNEALDRMVVASVFMLSSSKCVNSV